MNPRVIRFDAYAVTDGTGLEASPGSALIEVGGGLPKLLAAGVTADVLRHPAARDAEIVARPSSVLIPGLVNAHTHLDLTHIGPRPYEQAEGEGGFVGWVEMVRSRRLRDDAAIVASVRRGIELSLAGGTVAVGDIAGAPGGRASLAPWRALRDSPLIGVSFLEFFSMGKYREEGLAAGLAALDAGLREAAGGDGGVRIGLQPHAPNTVALSSYRRAAAAAKQRGAPVCTHLAETEEERRFVASGDGPQRELLDRLGIWSESALEELGKGEHPVAHVASVLRDARFLAAHVNDCDDDAMQTLADSRVCVAYCPRASEYFGAERYFGPHRYRDMLGAGITVALGTDSIVNLPSRTASIRTGGMSVLDEIRLLSRRDRADPMALLRMATMNGATALGLDPEWFRLGASGDGAGRPIAGLVAVHVTDGEGRKPADQVAASQGLPELLVRPSPRSAMAQ